MDSLTNSLSDIKLDHNTQEQVLEMAFNMEIDYMVKLVIGGDLNDDMIFAESPFYNNRNEDHIKYIIQLVTTNNYGFNLINQELIKKNHMITDNTIRLINEILEMYVNHLNFHLS